MNSKVARQIVPLNPPIVTEVQEEKNMMEMTQPALIDVSTLDDNSSKKMLEFGSTPHTLDQTAEQQLTIVVEDGRESQLKMDIIVEFGTDVMDCASDTTLITTSIALPTANTTQNIAIKPDITTENGSTLDLPPTQSSTVQSPPSQSVQSIVNKGTGFLGPEWGTKSQPLPVPPEATQRRIDAKKRAAAVLHETHMKQNAYRENFRKGLGGDGRQLNISSLSRLASMAATYLHLTGKLEGFQLLID